MNRSVVSLSFIIWSVKVIHSPFPGKETQTSVPVSGNANLACVPASGNGTENATPPLFNIARSVRKRYRSSFTSNTLRYSMIRRDHDEPAALG